jgi:hypothetical protein
MIGSLPMSIGNLAALRLAALALPLLLATAGAYGRDLGRDLGPTDPAQSNSTEDRTVGSGAGMDEPVVPQAPIGHRQPRAADLPAMSPNEEDAWVNRVNRDTDRKLQICRSC